MRIHEPKTTARIFASGRRVVTGVESEDDSRLASLPLCNSLASTPSFQSSKFKTSVGSCDVKFPIRLEGLAYSYGQSSSYEPEVCISFLFSCRSNKSLELVLGLIYRMIKPEAVFFIFVSGKIVLTGAKVSSFFFHYLLPHHPHQHCVR